MNYYLSAVTGSVANYIPSMQTVLGVADQAYSISSKVYNYVKPYFKNGSVPSAEKFIYGGKVGVNVLLTAPYRALEQVTGQHFPRLRAIAQTAKNAMDTLDEVYHQPAAQHSFPAKTTRQLVKKASNENPIVGKILAASDFIDASLEKFDAKQKILRLPSSNDFVQAGCDLVKKAVPAAVKAAEMAEKGLIALQKENAIYRNNNPTSELSKDVHDALKKVIPATKTVHEVLVATEQTLYPEEKSSFVATLENFISGFVSMICKFLLALIGVGKSESMNTKIVTFTQFSSDVHENYKKNRS